MNMVACTDDMSILVAVIAKCTLSLKIEQAALKYSELQSQPKE